MRALTLKPHWAHAVAHLGKRCENRSRPIPPALIGQRIAIHAGAMLPRLSHWVADLDDAAPECLVFVVSEPPGPIHVGNGHPLDTDERLHVQQSPRMAFRAIVATAVLAGEWRQSATEAPDWHELGAHWWRLDDVRTLAEPIPHQRGQLGLWRLPPAIASTLA